MYYRKSNGFSLRCVVIFFIVIFFSLFGHSESFLLDDKDPYKVCSFNVQHIGYKKIADPVLLSRIVEIVKEFDLVLIQEYREATQASLPLLWKALNDTGIAWGLSASEPLGRKTYKEQYLFFYRLSTTNVLSSYQTPDVADVYEREPYCVEVEFLSSLTNSKKRVVFAAMHIKPLGAVAELTKLPDTIKEIDAHFPRSDAVITMGDFNADCNYLSNTAEGNLEIFKPNTDFTSLINSDTTVADGACSYDRAILYGNGVTVDKATVVNFQANLGITQDEADDISDHFPIELQLF